MLLRMLRILALIAAVLAAPPVLAADDPQVADDPQGDAFLAGYIQSILERQLGWERGTYRLEVRDRAATLLLLVDDPERRAAAEDALGQIDALQSLTITVAVTGDASLPEPRPGPILFPVGDFFRPLIADPKEPRFFMSLLEMDTPTDRVTAASVGYGESFGLWRAPGDRAGDGWQLSFVGGLFAQFNLSAPSSDLVNADYNIGFRLSQRTGRFSTRWRLYHQSSHLGDEFLLSQPDIERMNLSIEVVDVTFSYERSRWRAYGGVGYMIGRDPSDLEPGMAQAGAEYRSTRVHHIGRFLAGLDVRILEEEDWETGVSLKAGFELGPPDPGRRNVRLMLEAYDGFAPFGQFFRTDDIRYYGAGIYFGF
ncbi:hypothetical protein SVA_0775 [Sulfurifustis variabilis]|uniref:DUF1207 domain-containing protein n=2 Tax=Sulfurifustis variabilis TaxID=1675686 RepID=A0A1B4V7M9_9GAMM|nr:hypothetical protein SVA_0775 [Sulfurifustis variabilis]